ncbi:TDT family transporter [Streptococcus penaeicida]|uniref:TDT family transporter n=1 Tax=Streptococcus penaeicida TaxID=1765960 RepID=UPI0039EE02A0
MRHFHQPPLVLSGLILGMTALGNLLGNFSQFLRFLFQIPAAILYLYLIFSIIKEPKRALQELKSPLIASVFPTFFMAGLLFSSLIIKSGHFSLGHSLWCLFLIGNIGLMLYYIWTFVIPFKWSNVFPSWSVLFVGIAVAALTAPASQHFRLGQAIFWLGLLLTFLVLPFMTYKTYKIGLEGATKPNISTFCAPLSLLAAAYLATFPQPAEGMVIFLVISSQVVYFFVLAQLPVLIKRAFNPGFAAFTFPFVISATACRASLIFLGLEENFQILILTETLIATVLVTYVFINYMIFLTKKKIQG